LEEFRKFEEEDNEKQTSDWRTCRKLGRFGRRPPGRVPGSSRGKPGKSLRERVDACKQAPTLFPWFSTLRPDTTQAPGVSCGATTTFFRFRPEQPSALHQPLPQSRNGNARATGQPV